ncbi:MAG: 23S rRNA (uracil(1939)-C(5))-methyltransferase RlmD [Clostridiales bacterium]|jgi:23S rRNA (uracil1939-C5)-methyltransferase|nr:23S rRNA (uracil(1939)-C(5))-methyltransferase RlmD [Clostridiales bacterium]
MGIDKSIDQLPRKNDEAIIRVTGVSNQGLGVGHPTGDESLSSFVIFAPKTAPGDLARVHITKVKQGYAFAKVLEILEASPSRTEPDCPAYGGPARGGCGGCCFRHIAYAEELRLKRRTVEETLKRIGGVELDVKIIPSPETLRYRNKAQFPFGFAADGRAALGVFAERSHRLVEGRDCLLMPGEFSDIGAYVRDFINTNKLTVYNEETGTGLFRHLYIRKGRRSGEILVCLVINGKGIPGEDALARGLVSAFPAVRSVAFNVNTRQTNVILGEDYRLLLGAGYICDGFCGLKLRISPKSFYQVNSPAAEVLYKAALDMAGLSEGDTALDLFCGVGAIGLYFAKEARVNVIGMEITREAVEDAKENARLNNIKNIEFIQTDLSGGFVPRLKPDAVIVDPPRKGLGAELVNAISDVSPGKVIYISCDPGTLARDIGFFRERGYAAVKAVAVDMFPRTQHVECAVLLTKVKNG